MADDASLQTPLRPKEDASPDPDPSLDQVVVSGDRKNELRYSGLFFEVKIKGVWRTILSDVSGSVHGGQVLCIVGPSGAGKTTMMDALTLKSTGGRARGTVTLDGHRVTPQVIADHFCIVEQHESTWGFLTVWESLIYAVELYFGDSLTPEAKVARADQCMNRMGLAGVRDTRVGDSMIRGVSGGQRKRLLVAMALVKQPSVLLLDEPTTGLDAAAAAHTMKFITELISTGNLIVVCTIHQPSAATFASFDKLLLLSRARVAYSGEAKNAVPYFAELDPEYAMPEGTSPAEFLLDLVNADFTSDKKVERILDKYIQPVVPETTPTPLPERLKGSDGVHFEALLRRQLQLTFMNPFVFWAKCLFTLFVTTMIGLMYYRFHNRDNAKGEQVIFTIVVPIMVACFSTVISAVIYGIAAVNFDLEIVNGMVRRRALFGVQCVITILCSLLVSVSIILPPFIIIHLGWDKIVACYCLLVIYVCFFELAAQACGCLCKSPYTAIFAYVCWFFPSFISSSIFIRWQDTPWPLKLLYFLSPISFWMDSYVYYQWDDQEWAGAEYCWESGNENCTYQGTDLPGFKCDDSKHCFGRSGHQVQTSVGEHWGGHFLMSGNQRYGRDFPIVFTQLALMVAVLFYAFERMGLRQPLSDTNETPGELVVHMKKGEQEEEENTSDEDTRLLAGQDVVRGNNRFVFDDISFKVNLGSKDEQGNDKYKHVLNGISGEVRSGEAMYVMGPSGAGKTSLLNVVTLQAGYGEAEGTVTVNGNDMDKTLLEKQCCVVGQEESTWGHLTVEESIMFAAGMYMGLGATEQEKQQRVDRYIASLGLETCRDTVVGDLFLRGISGGQKKRVLVAMALVKEPTVLFMDEPTSGLDAAAAAHTIQFVSDTCVREKLIVFATIHQPSASTFASFDHLLVLSRGRTAYSGKASEAEVYFRQTLGVEPSEEMAPGEFLLEAVNADFIRSELLVDPDADVDKLTQERSDEVDALLDQYEYEPREEQQDPLLPEVPETTTFLGSIRPICSMYWKLLLRHPAGYMGQTAFATFVVLFILTMQLKARKHNNDHVVRWLGACMTSMIFAAHPHVILLVLKGHEDNQLIYSQVRNGMGNSHAYAVVMATFDIGMCVVVAVIQLTLLLIIQDIYGDSAGGFLVSMFIFNVAVCMAGRFYSTEANGVLSVIQFLGYFVNNFALGGTPLMPKQTPWAMRWMFYVFPSWWASISLSYTTFHWEILTGTELCYEADTDGCQYNYHDGQVKLPGWNCTDDTPDNDCWGSYGDQVLDSLHNSYQNCSSEDHVARNFGIVSGMAFVFFVLYMVRLHMRCHTASKINPPKSNAA